MITNKDASTQLKKSSKSQIVMKTKTQILLENGIDIMQLDDNFNTNLFYAMERYKQENENYTISIEGDYIFDRSKFQCIYAGDIFLISRKDTTFKI